MRIVAETERDVLVANLISQKSGKEDAFKHVTNLKNKVINALCAAEEIKDALRIAVN